MAQYYDTTPWLIPKADDRLAALFRQHGSFFSVKKGSMLDAINIKGDGHNVTFLQAGLLGQCYDTGEPGRPHAISCSRAVSSITLITSGSITRRKSSWCFGIRMSGSAVSTP